MKLIKNPEDHKAAITRLSGMMDRNPAPGTPEAEELEVLAHLIEDYEEKAHNIGLPDPLDAIRFRMEQQGLKLKELAPYFGSAGRASEVLNGKRALTLAMIRKLQEGLGIPAVVLIQKPEKKRATAHAWAEKCSSAVLREICKREYFPGFKGTAREAKKRLEQLLPSFLCFGEAVPALNRQALRGEAAANSFALLAWKTRVLQRAQEKKMAVKFDAKAITAGFLEHLVGLSVHSNGPQAAIEWLESYGIRVVIEPHLPGTHLDGAAMSLPDGSPVIGLTLRHDRIDYFWFCLLHELAHVVLHIAKGKSDGFLDDFEGETKDALEGEANAWASDRLIPAKEWQLFHQARRFDAISVRAAAKRLVIHPAILAGRIRKEKNNYTLLAREIGQGKVRSLLLGAK